MVQQGTMALDASILENAVPFKITNAVLKNLQGIYSPVDCLRHRKEHVDGATSFKGDDFPVIDELFASQDDELKQWISKITEGILLASNKAKEILEVEEVNLISKILAHTVIASGSDWQCTNFADLMLGKLIVVLTGETFVAGCSISAFTPDIDKGADVFEISTQLGTMTREQLVAKGGFYILLGAGEAVAIPPGYIIFQCNQGNLDFENVVNSDGKNGCDFLVSELHILSLLMSSRLLCKVNRNFGFMTA